MKLVFVLVLLFAWVTLQDDPQRLNPSTSEEILTLIQSNNYNLYTLFFYDSTTDNERKQQANKDIEQRIDDVLLDNEDVYFAKIDVSNPNFDKLKSVVGVTSTPSVLLMVHGKGTWISGTNSYLVVERLKDFLPNYKEASLHHANPEY